ncbi:uncharacterized protein PODANS_7_2580 [Podospora anserina S mat+]|uniref:Podospora anserina S mat+ genomic DNA chromosome 7, supercontig 1 n=1 Tax=Podospora anserina (strain S / ATCC MYA-4624 / DSM 980 / FGSC 10383) TaxID=515849 RepID=B2AVL0_PODAN|nr:uncharacterized protein PODANS_7_2580 [Podospora anserina S mat+]CAP68434.1 unnamed protein product [Podospora anserina S mat+]CDP31906.1 Putative protein of unknown function [Podospora anserina S mat+]
MLRPTHNIKGLHLLRQRLSTPGPSLAPAQRAIVEQASASFARRFSGGTLKKPQRQPHHRGTGATRDLPGKHIPAMGENTDTLAQVDAPFPLTEVDKWVLSQTDEEFKCHDWDELCVILQNNNLHLLKRKPSDLRRYIKWTTETKAEYGNITNFLITHRLPKPWGKPPFTPASSIPFENPSDYRVLMNDWPYGFAPGISHIVVWTRTPIATDDTVGDMTHESRKIVADFIKRFFVDRLGPGGEKKVIWFKNWVALQSVRTVDHVHVLVRDVEPQVLEEWSRELECHKA